jgi:hypothetical protein
VPDLVEAEVMEAEHPRQLRPEAPVDGCELARLVRVQAGKEELARAGVTEGRRRRDVGEQAAVRVGDRLRDLVAVRQLVCGLAQLSRHGAVQHAAEVERQKEIGREVGTDAVEALLALVVDRLAGEAPDEPVAEQRDRMLSLDARELLQRDLLRVDQVLIVRRLRVREARPHPL